MSRSRCSRKDCGNYNTRMGNKCDALDTIYDDDYQCPFYTTRACALKCHEAIIYNCTATQLSIEKKRLEQKKKFWAENPLSEEVLKHE